MVKEEKDFLMEQREKLISFAENLLQYVVLDYNPCETTYDTWADDLEEVANSLRRNGYHKQRD